MNAPLRFANHAAIIGRRLIDAILPKGGYVVALVEAYFDESIGHAMRRDPDGSERRVNIICIAGYLMDSDAAKRLCTDWQAVLDWRELPYFHMVDCAHGNGVFAKLSRADRIQVEARMIAAIKRRTIRGFAIAVNIDQYNIFMPIRDRLAGTPYSFCANMIMSHVNDWLNRVKFGGRVAFFYEKGHDSQSEANAVIRDIYELPEMKSIDRYAGHGFYDKKLMLPLQAADLLAWLSYTEMRRHVEAKRPTPRKDLASLMQHPHKIIMVTPKMMTDMARAWGYDVSRAEELLRQNYGPEYLKTGKVSPEVLTSWRQRP